MRVLITLLISVCLFGQSIGGTKVAGNPIHNSVTSVSFAASPYTVLSTNSYLYCDASGGAVVLTLPATSGSGREITVKKIDSSANACTSTSAGSDVIDGATTISLTSQWAAAKLIDRAAGFWDRAHVNQLGGVVTGVSSNNTIGAGSITTAMMALTLTATFTDIAPVAGDDGLFVILNPASAVHLTRVSCGVTGTTSAVVNLVKGGASLIADMTATAGTVNAVAVTTWANGSSQCGGTTSCAVAAHAPVTVHVGTVTGSPTALVCSLDYTVD